MQQKPSKQKNILILFQFLFSESEHIFFISYKISNDLISPEIYFYKHFFYYSNNILRFHKEGHGWLKKSF